MPAVDDLLHANEQFAARFAGPPSHRPSLHLAVVACMDTRLDLYAALGLAAGEAHLIRNAGGIPTDDVLRSLALSQRALGTREIAVIHHTECGMDGFDDDAFRAELAAETGVTPPWRVRGFSDLYEDARHSAQIVRDCPWLEYRDHVRGFVYDVATGRLTPVD